VEHGKLPWKCLNSILLTDVSAPRSAEERECNNNGLRCPGVRRSVAGVRGSVLADLAAPRRGAILTPQSRRAAARQCAAAAVIVFAGAAAQRPCRWCRGRRHDGVARRRSTVSTPERRNRRCSALCDVLLFAGALGRCGGTTRRWRWARALKAPALWLAGEQQTLLCPRTFGATAPPLRVGTRFRAWR
jgi:hypothetical protein